MMNINDKKTPLIEKKLQRRLSQFKSLVLVNPQNGEYWYELSKILFKLGKNEDGFKTLLNAKKLGNANALKLLVSIIQLYADVDCNLSMKIQKELLGMEVDHV